MHVVDWAARWDPVPDDRPARVWLPPQRTPASAAVGGPGAALATAAREPRSTTLTLTPQQAAELPLWLPHVLIQQDLRPGDRVAVDLADLRSVHLTGLELLMGALWRRVGTDGEVLLTGGAAGLRAQLACLHITPASCRAAVYGPPAAGSAAGPVPAPVDTGMRPPRSAPVVPQQHARPALSGHVDLTADLRTQAPSPPQPAVPVPADDADRAAAGTGRGT